MDYHQIKLPFGLPFENPHFAFPRLSPSEALAYYEWFMEQIPIRIGILTDAVHSTPGFGDWQPDLTPDSLDVLGEWFVQHVTVRPTTDEERHEHAERMPEFIVQEYDWKLTEETLSLCFDVGLYLAKAIERNIGSYTWTLVTKPKNNIFTNQPVLEGVGDPYLNPVWNVRILARGAADGRKGGTGLRKLFDLAAEAPTKYPNYKPKRWAVKGRNR